MRKSRFTEAQIVAIMKTRDAGTAMAELASKHDIRPNTLRQWRAKYGGSDADDVAKVRASPEESDRLKRIVPTVVQEVTFAAKRGLRTRRHAIYPLGLPRVRPKSPKGGRRPA
jgi:putative transposase